MHNDSDNDLRAPLVTPTPTPPPPLPTPTLPNNTNNMAANANNMASPPTSGGFTSLSSLPQQQHPGYANAHGPAGGNGHNHNTVTSAWHSVRRWDAATLIRNLRYFNVLLAILQALAGFMGLFDLVKLDITSFLISVYAIIFALLLLAFECRFTSMEPKIRQQFGFLFTYRGRTAFIFCVGFMDFGMEGSLAWFVGLLMCLNALFNCLVMLCHPEFRNGHLSSTMDPTATYTGAGEETASLLSDHPEYAAKAGAFVLQQAKENPQFAAQVAQAYSTQPANAASNTGGYVPPAPTVPTH